MQEIRNDSLDFGLAIADNLLARDQLKASIRYHLHIPPAELAGETGRCNGCADNKAVG